jgi:DNA-binding transcriptional regulator YbjK
MKATFQSKEDAAILGAITTGERAAIAKYNELIENYERHADHLPLLTGQRDGIIEALKKIETLLQKYHN